MNQKQINFPHSRSSDPLGSFVAGDKAKGTASGQRMKCLSMVRKWPGKTAKQIAELAGVPGAHRRLPELRQMGMVISITGKQKGRELLWYPKTEE